MRVEVLALTGVKFEGEAEEIQLTTTNGQIGILPHHEPMVAQVVAGPVTVKPTSGKPEIFATFGGLVEIFPDRVRLLADEADHESELVAEEIEEALERAKQLRSEAKTDHDLEVAQQMIDRQTVRLGVARLRRHNRDR